jgi:hypothetical protein
MQNVVIFQNWNLVKRKTEADEFLLYVMQEISRLIGLHWIGSESVVRERRPNQRWHSVFNRVVDLSLSDTAKLLEDLVSNEVGKQSTIR